MARARFGGRGGAVDMKALRGCALGRRSARDPGVRQIRVARASERAARGRSQQGGHGHERAAAHGMWGEAAGHARAKANTRRSIARGAGEGRETWKTPPFGRATQPGAVGTLMSCKKLPGHVNLFFELKS